MKTFVLVSVFVVVAAALINAMETVYEASLVFKFGTPTFFGSGCPDDSVRIIPATDGQSVSVLFSEYNAQTTPDSKRGRKSCNLAVPVDVQPGISIGVFRVDYRGNTYVPNEFGAFTQFDVEYYFAGQMGPVVTQKYNPGFNNNIFIRNTIKFDSIVWSPCGASTNFRINSAIIAFKDPNSYSAQQSQIAVDSVDTTVQSGFRYHIMTKKC
jgi:hypothetical protein